MPKKWIYILIFVFIYSIIIVHCKTNSSKKKGKKGKKVIKNEKDITILILDWAKKNNIYINDKLALIQNFNKDKYYYFSAERRIQNNTLLLKVPYEIMITQSSFNNIYKKSKNKQFENLWYKIKLLKTEYLYSLQSKQLFYLSILLENSLRKKKGPIYKKYKEYLSMYEQMEMDVYPIFYKKNEKELLRYSNLGSKLKGATDLLNQEFSLITHQLNISIPNQKNFFKTRIISLISSTNFNNTNYNYSEKDNETVIVPFLDCFTKTISSHKANARFEIKKEKKANLTNYYLEVYSTDNILVGGDINLKWKERSNNELLLYYGFVEEDNPYNSTFFVEIINSRLKKDLNISNEIIFKNIKKKFYDLNREYDDQTVIDTYKYLSSKLDKYKGKKEGYYEIMYDNLKGFYEIYDKVLNNKTIEEYIYGNEKSKSIKIIINQEKELIEKRLKYLKKAIERIKEEKNDKTNKTEDL
jgi:hypothetical protein